MKKVIHVGGTGRCFTSGLGKLISKHPDVYNFKELRFIVDSGGLYRVVNSKNPIKVLKRKMLYSFGCGSSLLTMKHKWFVLMAGLKIVKGLSIWRLIKHDCSKFLPSELPHYGRQFFGNKDQPYKFMLAWLNHQNNNNHHWEYWIPRTGHSKCDPPYLSGEPLEMKHEAVREMVAGWLGASRAYDGNWPKSLEEWGWFKENFNKIRLNPKTRKQIIVILRNLKIWNRIYEGINK